MGRDALEVRYGPSALWGGTLDGQLHVVAQQSHLDAVELRQLRLDLLPIKRLEMGDINRVGLYGHFGDFRSQEGRGEVTGRQSQGLHLVREGDLDDQALDAKPFHALPDPIRGARVSRVNQTVGSVLADDVAVSRNGVIHFRRKDRIALKLEWLFGPNLLVAHHRALRRWNGCEVRPDAVVENIVLEVRDHLRAAQNRELTDLIHGYNVVHEERNSLDVVEMRVREKDVRDVALGFVVEGDGNRACVEQQKIVNEESGGIVPRDFRP